MSGLNGDRGTVNSGEWATIGERLRAASPERFGETVAKLIELAEIREEAARMVATGSPAALAVLGPRGEVRK